MPSFFLTSMEHHCVSNNDLFQQEEKLNQVRMTWNLWPSDNDIISKMAIPLAVLYNPLGHHSVPLRPNNKLLKCSCGAIFNLFCVVDSQKNQWICNFCSKRSYFSEKSSSFMYPMWNTEDYVINPAETVNSKSSTIILLVLDTNLPGIELKAMMNTVSQVVTELPSETLVGLITIGFKTVNIHQLEGSSSIPTSYDFSGSRELTAIQLATLLGLDQPRRIGMFLRSIGSCIDMLTHILSTIRPTLHPEKKKRRTRPTGKALSIALNLIENIKPRTRSRVLLFVDGPCTFGPGKVTSVELRETMRSHLDIRKRRASFLKPASSFYNRMACRARQINCSIDMFAYSQIEVGLHEMSYCSGFTGGQIYSAGSFSSPSFKLNLQAALRREIIIGDSFQVKASNGLKVCNSKARDLLVLDSDTTIPVFLEIQPKKQKGTGYIQFVTAYNNRLRVTTIARNWVDPYLATFLPGLDPVTATVILAHLAKSQEDPILWINEQLSKIRSINGSYETHDQNVIELRQLIDRLCNSPIVNTFNTSPDELALSKFLFYKSSVNKSLMMFQPRVWNFDPGLVDPTEYRQQHGPSWKVEDFYHRVIVYHDSSVDKLSSEMIKKIMEALAVQTRNPVPEILGFKQRG